MPPGQDALGQNAPVLGQNVPQESAASESDIARRSIQELGTCLRTLRFCFMLSDDLQFLSVVPAFNCVYIYL